MVVTAAAGEDQQGKRTSDEKTPLCLENANQGFPRREAEGYWFRLRTLLIPIPPQPASISGGCCRSKKYVFT